MALYARLVAWRYLYRQRHDPMIRLCTVLFWGASVATQIACFVFGQALIGALFTIPTTLLFVVFFLLNFFSVFTTVSTIGVVLGVTALTVVLSVSSGFKASFRQKVLGVNAHVLVVKYGLDFSEYRQLMDKIGHDPDVAAVSPFVINEMMLAHGPVLGGVLVKGIDTNLSPRVLDITARLRVGKLEDLNRNMAPNDGGAPLPAMFIGEALQRKLKAKIGDRVRVVSPKVDLDPSNFGAGGANSRLREFRIAGFFYYGFDEYDRRLCYVNLAEAQAFFGPDDVVTGVEMRLHDFSRSHRLADRLTQTLGLGYSVKDWEDLNHNLFAALAMQETALVLFLTLIILVAAFNIVATLTMLVVQKNKEIAIQKSMGARSSQIAAIFQIAGLTIGAFGTSLGVSFGLLLCKVVEHFGYALDSKVYMIDQLPVDIRASSILITVAITFAICFLATLYPSLRAAALHPVDGLRYE